MTYNDLQGVVQLIQQWLLMNGSFKNPAIVQATRPDVSASLQYTPES